MPPTPDVKQDLDRLLQLASADAEQARADLAKRMLAERAQDPEAFDQALREALSTWPVEEVPRAEEEWIGRPRWRNYVGDYARAVAPEDWWVPPSVPVLAEWLRGAVRRRRRVRVVGSGHSSSDIAAQSDVLVDITELRALEVRPAALRSNLALPSGHHLVYAQAGVLVRDLTARLWDARLALPNMGSYNGQTLAGAISTGTHGSGLHTGPLPDLVAALDLLTVDRDGRVQVVRFEPDDGPTAPDAFAAFAAARFGCPARLEKDTRRFEAAVVSLGSLGIVVGFVLEVVDRFWMSEDRKVTSWRALKPRLLERVERAREKKEHFEVSFLPNPIDGQIRCLTVVRARHDPLDAPPPERKLVGQWILDLADLIGTRPIGAFASAFPEFMAQRVLDSFHKSADDPPFVSSAPRVFVLGYGASMKITSCEAHVPLDRAADAIDEIVALARVHAERRWFHTAPVGVRFAGRSRMALSMDHDRESCTLEVPFPLGARGWSQVLSRIEERLVARCDARMHWGQRNATTAGRAAEQYPRWEDFLELRERFGALGTWDSPFTDRMGISELPVLVGGAPVPIEELPAPGLGTPGARGVAIPLGTAPVGTDGVAGAPLGEGPLTEEFALTPTLSQRERGKESAALSQGERGKEWAGVPSEPSIAALATALESDWEATVRALALQSWEGYDAWAEGDVLPPPLPIQPVADEGLPVLEAPGGPVVASPRSLQDVVDLVRDATAAGERVRALGADHSFSPDPGLNVGDDVTVDLRGLRGERVLDPTLLTRPADAERVIEVWGGTRLFEIVDLLNDRGRALANLGNYDRQAIAGALATDTHGTGLAFPPFSGLVESLLVVGSGGRRFRIDRADPLYQPAAYAQRFPNVTHLRDDALLADVAMGLGAMGVVVAVALRTRRAYHLAEERILQRWVPLRDQLLAADLDTFRESVAISTYRVDGVRRCLRTRRWEVDAPEHRTWDQAHRTFWAAVASPSPLAGRIAEHRLKDRADRGRVVHSSLGLLVDDAFVARWDKVLVTGPPAVRAHSLEIGVPWTDRALALQAVDRALEALDPAQNGGTFFPTSPVNLRWCGASEAGVSPMFQRPTLMIEVPFLLAQRADPAERVDPVLRKLEVELVRDFGARPHWGKVWWLDHAPVAAVYPGWARWSAARQQLDPEGTFSNALTRRVGLTP